MSKLLKVQPILKPIAVENREKFMQSALDRDLPCLRPEPGAERESVCIVGGAPSLAGSIADIAKQKKRGRRICAVNGSHEFLISRGVVPDFCVIMDAKDRMVEEITPHKGVTYYVASIANPSTFDLLEGCDVRVWHAWNSDADHEFLKRQNKPWILVGGGVSVGLRSIDVMFLRGHRSMTIYGMDSSFEGETHAYKDRQPKRVIDVTVEGKTFKTSPILGKQAQDFQDVYEKMIGNGCTITVKGEGLLSHVWKCLRRQQREWAEVTRQIPAIEKWAWGPLQAKKEAA